MNRQVPEKQQAKTIAVIGNGKVARHMIRYFELVGQHYSQWARTTHTTNPQTHPKPSRLARFKTRLNKLMGKHQQQSLAEVIADSQVVLLLISDDQIERFIDKHSALKGKTLVHFSGALHTEKALGCHPLMTFGANFYSLEQYQNIPFVVDEGVSFSALFPLFKNPVHVIEAEDKVKYHAMCVMAGNFSQMLWQAVNKELEGMNLPKGLMTAYLRQNLENFIDHPEAAATGPFVRGDFDTIARHQNVLEGQALGELYQAFYDLYQGPAPKKPGSLP